MIASAEERPGMHEIQAEVDRNYDAFVQQLPTIINLHRDKYALMKDGVILGYYSSAYDARTAAEAFIKDKLYSIQHVTDAAVNLGFFTNAVPGYCIQP